MERSPLVRAAIVLVAIAAALYLMSFLWRVAGFLFDLLIMAFIAWIIASNVRRLAKRVQRVTHLSFGPAVGIAYLIVLLPIIFLLALVVPLAVGQAVTLSRKLPELASGSPEFLSQIQGIANRLGIQVDLASVYPKDALTNAAGSIGTWISAHAVDIAQRTLATLFQVVLLLILSVYMVLEGNRLASVFFRLLPRNWHDEAVYIYDSMDSIFESWLRGVLIVGGIFASAVFIVMMIARIPYAVPVAVIAGLLVVIPFIGDFIAIGLPVAIAITEGSFGKAALVGGVLLVMDILVINMFVSPRVIGGAVRLPTVFVVLSVLLGARVAGPWGAFLSVPVAALIYSTAISFADRAKNGAKELQAVEDI